MAAGASTSNAGGMLSVDSIHAQLNDALRCAVIATDLDGRIVHWELYAERMYGWPAREIIGRSLVDALACASGTLKDIFEGARAGAVWRGVQPLRHRDGTIVEADVLLTPLVGERGSITGVAVRCSEPISCAAADTASMDGKRAAGKDSLRISPRRQLERLVHHIDGIVWEGTVDLASNEVQFTFVSERLRKILGREPQSWLDDAGNWVAAIHEEDRVWALEKCVDATRARDDHRLEYRMTTLDGDIVWVRDVVRLIEERDGVVTVAGIMLDITERKRAEAALVEAKERAEEMMRLKSAFLTNMSHEIRTPLTGIIGFSEILAEETTDELRSMSELIINSGERLMLTLDSVMDLAELESGTLTLDQTRVNLVRQIKKIVQMFERQAKARGLELRLECEAPTVEAMADKGGVSRVLTNLLSNALKFTEDGHVIIRIGKVGPYARFQVEDTGIGIGGDFLPRLFEEFEQESGGLTRNYEGVGIGLSITKRLVDLMGGLIAVSSEKGKGSTFTVHLPLAEGVGRRAERHVPAPPAPERRRILAVEDEADAIALLYRMLGDRYELAVATSAREALEAARSVRFDLVVMDIRLGPGPDGREIMAGLRATPEYADVPMIACTAYALPGDADAFIEDGFDAYLGKPYQKAPFLDLVASYLPASA